MKAARKSLSLVFVGLALAGMVISQSPVRVTRQNFMDNAGIALTDAFEFGDFCSEYSIAVTRLGQGYLKKLSDVSLPDPISTFRLNNLQTFW